MKLLPGPASGVGQRARRTERPAEPNSSSRDPPAGACGTSARRRTSPGAALAVPRSVRRAAATLHLCVPLRRANGAPREIRLTLGERGIWSLKLDDNEQRPWGLQPEVWTSSRPMVPADTWATVTPIVLDRYPKKRESTGRAVEVEQIIAASCNHLWADRSSPVPIIKVVATPSPLFAGVPHAASFPPLLSGPDSRPRFHMHALIIFAEPITGPLMVGAGRYRGYGLCRPWREGA